MKRQKTRNIVRSKQRKQWTVHITKTFSDSSYGSKEKSLEAATKLRNIIYSLILKDFEKPYIQENVQYYENKRPNKIYKYWRAVYLDAFGVRCQKHFNIDKHGYDEAKNLAIKKAIPGRKWNLYESYLFEDKKESQNKGKINNS